MEQDHSDTSSRPGSGSASPTGSSAATPGPVPPPLVPESTYVPPSSNKRSRVSHACENCRRRKVKCLGGQPCRHCFEHGLTDCHYVDPSQRPPPKPRAKRGAKKAAGAAAGAATAAPLTDGAASDSRGSSEPSGSEPPQPQQQQLHHFTAHPPSGVASQPISQADIDEISESMTLFFHIDAESNKATHYTNFGSSSGLQTLQPWSSTFREPAIHKPNPLAGRVPRRILFRENALFPARHFASRMLDVYFETFHAWFPILDRSLTYALLDEAVGASAPAHRNHHLAYAVLACGTLKFELMQGLNSVNSTTLLSRIFADIANTALQARIAHFLSIESVQAALLLAQHASVFPDKAPWLQVGTACRCATDIGLHLHLNAPQFRAIDACLPTWAKTMALLVTMDANLSLTTGRPLLLHTEEIFLNTDIYLRTPENQARFDDALLLDEDHYFVWSLRLAEITSKVARTLNGIATRRNLPYTLPELHGILSKFRSELPARLQFNPAETDALQRTQAAAIQLRYFGLVIALYRPLVSTKSTAIQSPLKQQYLALLEDAMVAAMHTTEHLVAGGLGGSIHLYPSSMGMHEILCLLTVICLLATNDDTPDRAQTQRALRYLDRVRILLVTMSSMAPMLARLLLFIGEIHSAMADTPLNQSALKAQLDWLSRRLLDSATAVLDFVDLPDDAQVATVNQLVAQYAALDVVSANAAAAVVAGSGTGNGANGGSNNLAYASSSSPPLLQPFQPVMQGLGSALPLWTMVAPSTAQQPPQPHQQPGAVPAATATAAATASGIPFTPTIAGMNFFPTPPGGELTDPLTLGAGTTTLGPDFALPVFPDLLDAHDVASLLDLTSPPGGGGGGGGSPSASNGGSGDGVLGFASAQDMYNAAYIQQLLDFGTGPGDGRTGFDGQQPSGSSS
ncbi:hypothetical protein H9P43_002360 [Blastocladiella emersonii ATCC 22665]|nr:hypothetical protein H9P43_002360 [Blastocladiella emersonii ATCC 22665]